MATTPTAAAPAAIKSSGKVIRSDAGMVVFNPSGTNYELHLQSAAYSGPLNTPIQVTIRVTAKKVWTVPSGGNFIAPILGTPRTIQGRVRSISDRSMIVQAGTPVVVDLPADDSAFEMANGVIAVGSLVNVLALPGARFEP